MGVPRLSTQFHKSVNVLINGLQDVGQAELGQEIFVPKQELGNEKISALTLGFEL
jgi:hypothetical protein